MKTHFLILFLFILTGIGCQKSILSIQDGSIEQSSTPSDTTTSSADSNYILVDASKDGGVWWFPQSPETGFSETEDHQGKALADYLRSLGFHVDELPRDTVITNELLEKYSKIIRCAPYFSYSADELAAYKNFLNKSGSILLFQDFLANGEANDDFSEFLGLHFAGAISGDVIHFAPNQITTGVTSLYYFAGSVVMNSADNKNITVLGSLDKNTYTVLNSYDDPYNGHADIDPPAMGILNTYPNTRIFFLGDENGIESLPQPLTQNVVNWLFK